MKEMILLFVGIISAGFIYFAMEGRKVQTIKTEIEISAPPEKIWNLLTDIEKWHEWSPIINHSSGNVEVGAKVNITMISKEADKDGPKYSPTIIKLEDAKLLHWRAHMLAGFIFTNEKIFELQKTSTGTKLIHIETFSGLMASMMKGQMEKGVPPMLNAMNQAVKEMSEK